MSPEQTCQQWADELARSHEEFYRTNPKGTINSMVIIEAGDGHYEAVNCGWSNPFERAMTLAALRIVLQQTSATRYAFVGEVWMSKNPDEFGRPSLDPQRDEQVFTAVTDRRLPSPVVVAQQIIRGRSGGVRKLLRTPGEYDGIMGALTDLFEDGGETIQ